MMPSIIYLLVLLPLLGCGSKIENLLDVQDENGTPAVPPQPVVGSYLAACFDTPATVDRNACSASFYEENDVFTLGLTAQPYQLVPIANLNELRSIHVECLGADSSQVFSASLNLSSSALEQMSSLVVNTPDEPIKFVARFFANGDGNGQSGHGAELGMEKLDVSQFDDEDDEDDKSDVD